MPSYKSVVGGAGSVLTGSAVYSLVEIGKVCETGTALSFSSVTVLSTIDLMSLMLLSKFRVLRLSTSNLLFIWELNPSIFASSLSITVSIFRIKIVMSETAA